MRAVLMCMLGVIVVCVLVLGDRTASSGVFHNATSLEYQHREQSIPPSERSDVTRIG